MPELSRHHQRIRDRGVNRPVYWVVRSVLQPLIHVYFRLVRVGRGHVPARGPVILAANHRSFLDPFLIACCVRRPIYFMAKRELFERPLQGWLLNALGAFPVCRGESDRDAMDTARAVLRRGDPVVIFPEGTRTRHGALARPRRGVGRLALETAAPVTPVAVIGSERARRSWRIRPVRVRVRLGRPLTFPRVDAPSPRLAEEVTARIWPCVELQWEWLGGLPPLRRAVVIGAGPMGRALVALLARAGLEVELGCRSEDQARAVAQADGSVPSAAGSGGGRRGAGQVTVKPVRAIELQTTDLVVLAVPSRDLPAVIGQLGDRISSRAAVLTVSKGLVGPLGALPVDYVAQRVRARAIGWLGGPAHAGEALDWGAAVVVATADADFSAQLATTLADAGLAVERTMDLVGAQLAGCAKNVAALAAAAAGAAGMNAAGAAAGRLFDEVHALALARGAEARTFSGLAGVGDLVATALAAGSRNRRAGELLGRGLPADAAAAALDGTAEALDTTAPLSAALARADLEATATSALLALIEGRLSPDEWLAELRSAGESRARRAA